MARHHMLSLNFHNGGATPYYEVYQKITHIITNVWLVTFKNSNASIVSRDRIHACELASRLVLEAHFVIEWRKGGKDKDLVSTMEIFKWLLCGWQVAVLGKWSKLKSILEFLFSLSHTNQSVRFPAFSSLIGTPSCFDLI
jgi:hypothetical protein